MTRSKFSLQLLFLLFPFLVVAQGWERIYDVNDNKGAFCATRTLDGGLMIASIRPAIGGNFKRTFFKTDIAGNLTWQSPESLGNEDYSVVYDIVNTSDGNYVYGMEAVFNNSPISQNYVVKMAPDGNTLWQEPIFGSSFLIVSMAKTHDDGILILGNHTDPNTNDNETHLTKLDQSGAIVWEKSFMASGLSYIGGSVIETMNHDIVMTASKYIDANDVNAFAVRMDEDGVTLWESEYSNAPDILAQKVVELATGDIVIGGKVNWNSIISQVCLLKVDANGNQNWHQTYFDMLQYGTITELVTTSDGGIAVAGSNRTSLNPGGNLVYYLFKTDTDGTLLWQNYYGKNTENDCSGMLTSDDGGFYLYGLTLVAAGNQDAYLVKTDSLGISIPNLIKGTVYFDENQDCLYDNNETGMQQRIVALTDGTATYFTSTDSLGNYSFEVDTGTYELSAYPMNEYWLACTDTVTIDFNITFDTITQNFGMQSAIECPLLEVSIGTAFLRRCFENTYNIHYCNYGTTTAEDAYVEVLLDDAMIFQEAGIPPSSQNGNVLLFDLGDVAVGDCGNFNITVLLGDPTTCDSIELGQTHCVTAHIYPDSICLPSNNWSGASVEVEAVCEGDSILFLIQNVGNAPTAPNLDYIIIEDDVVLLQGNFDLIPAEIETIRLSTNGSTFRLEAEQEPNHPGMSMPSVSVEGCGNSSVIFSWGFLNIFAEDDGDPFVDINCLSNSDGFDPNAQTGFPIGYSEAHYISEGQDIEYLIRFQNTGTDTAFNIVILDTLSAFLDPVSVRPGASSHPYEFGISGTGILSFTFNNIMLPDSNVNLAASNGFVQFKISQQPNLPLETAIHNRAAIYFDFNDAILTNTTLHTVGEPLLSTVSVDPVPDAKMEVKVFPNPFQSRTQFEMNGMDLQDGLFQLFDVVGRKWYTQQFRGSSFTFEKSDLAKGVYFFTIEDAGVLLASGKVVVQ